MLAVFLQCCRANQLDFSPRKGRLQDIGRIYRAFRRACANNGVYFIHKQYDISVRPDFVQSLFHTFLKFAAVF